MSSPIEEPLVLQEEAGATSEGPPANAKPAVVVAASDTLWITLPRLPAGPGELAEMVAARSPLPAREIAWTEPVTDESGAIGLSICRRTLLERLADPATAVDERTGLSFCRAPAPVERQTMLTAMLVVVSLAGAAWAIATKPAAPVSEAEPVSVPSTVRLGDAASRESVGAVVDLAGRISGHGFSVTKVERRNDGSLQLDIASNDPDALRAAAATDPDLTSFAQIAQVRATGGDYRVSFARQPGAVSGRSVAVRPLAAETPFAASERIERYLTGLASRHTVRLTLSNSRPVASRPLEFAVSVEGPEADVLAVAQAIESGKPPIALTEWTFASADAGAEFSASLVVPWIEAP